ncbi:hypothetical protein VTN02DRAFT_2764 [Thermoascus thermophilus]
MDPQSKPSSPPPPYELHDPRRGQTGGAASGPCPCPSSSSSPRPMMPYIRPRQRTPVPLEHDSPAQQQQDESHGSPLLLLPLRPVSDNSGSGSGSVDDMLDPALAAWVEDRERQAQRVLRRFTRVMALLIVAGCSLYVGWWVVVLYARARREMDDG